MGAVQETMRLLTINEQSRRKASGWPHIDGQAIAF
jgi:hypothetical protein